MSGTGGKPAATEDDGCCACDRLVERKDRKLCSHVFLGGVSKGLTGMWLPSGSPGLSNERGGESDRVVVGAMFSTDRDRPLMPPNLIHRRRGEGGVFVMSPLLPWGVPFLL